MKSSPTLYDAYGRALAPSLSWMHQGGRFGGRERRNVFAIAEDSRQTVDKYTREKTTALARYLIANLGRIRGPLFDLTRYSIGNGLRPQSQADDDRAGQEYEDYFNDWADRCDITRKFTYWDLQKLASRAVDGDGDVGANTIIPGARSDHQLQLIESHRITSNNETTGAATEGWHDGVKTDGYGAPVAYQVREGKDQYRTIPAETFRLLMDPDRCDQDRGLSALSTTIDNAFDSDDILSFSKTGIKMREAVGFVVYTETGVHDSGLGLIEEGNTARDTGSLAMDTIQAGMIPRLKVSERIQDIGSSRPNPAFAGFLDYLVRDFAVGLGVPYEFVWDPSKLSGTAQRFILSKAQRRFEERQSLMRRFVAYDWHLLIGRAIARKELRPDKYWRRITLQGPAKITVDVGREANANRDDMKFGVRTMAEDVGERGGDWKDTRAQIDRETRDLLDRAKAIAQQYDITIDKALDLLRQNSPNPQAQAALPPSDPPAPDPGAGA